MPSGNKRVNVIANLNNHPDGEVQPVQTVEAFIAAFGKSVNTNDNCLCDKACPMCGNRENFNIVIRTLAVFRDDGCEETRDMEWGDDSYIDCCECGHEGKVSDFSFYGLDNKLTELNNQ